MNKMRTFILILSALVISFASIPLGTTNVSAQTPTCDEAFYSSNNILFYNPCATSCGGPTESEAVKVDTLTGSNNGEKIFNFWVASGLTSQQAAGITGSMQHEGGFSPFRQEISQNFPAGGWGIAQFTDGQRDAATAFVKAEIGGALFDQYYKDEFGRGVVESNGFIPNGVPVEVNDKFLLAELNYLLDHVKKLVPNDTRTSRLSTDYGQTIADNVTLYDYLKTVVQAPDAAIAWTYLYEYPANIKETSAARGNSAAAILDLYSAGISTTCGGSLGEGGMTIEEAIQFMDDYKNNEDNRQYISGAGYPDPCSGGWLINCTAFSAYFINKYTTVGGFSSGRTGNGSTLVATLMSRADKTFETGHSPRPYAVFSYSGGNMMCGDVKCGHTGVILGVDAEAGTVIVGEANCEDTAEETTAVVYPLSKFESDAYTYAYLGDLLKEDIQ